MWITEGIGFLMGAQGAAIDIESRMPAYPDELPSVPRDRGQRVTSTTEKRIIGQWRRSTRLRSTTVTFGE